MSFKLPDLIIESIIRDGLNNARRDETVIDDVFSELTRPFASKKYGVSEVEKIKAVIKNKEVSLVHAFNLVNANIPCISIQLAEDVEDESRAQMGGYQKQIKRDFTKPEELAKLVKVPSFTPDSHDPVTGIVRVPDSVNLAPVYANLLFKDSDGNEHQIIGGIINDAGAKQFMVARNSVVSLGAGEIKSSINYEMFQQRGNTENATIIIGIHTGEPLLTKYLYTLVKYFLLSRRHDMVQRGYQMSTYSGSDFSRNVEYGADSIFTRFLTLHGMLMHEWRSDKVQLVDSVNVSVTVPKDVKGNEALNLEDMTIKVKE